ncbi:MAG TPA: hypothetical protein VNV17_07220 [Solirubrobacteraceae bacterium]|jgi:hypothetical protein|nr:hypothetical protein [Solirubrobacteraceae bacterium]
MIDARFAILAAVVTVAGNAVYAVDTVRGNTQPNRVSWMLWTLAPMIAFAAEVTQGVGLQSLLTFAIGFGPLLVVCASFLDPKAYARVTLFDVLCGVLSLVALVAWAVTGRGSVAIFLSILADFFGAVPTLRKSYRDPESEHAVAFLAGVTGSIITLLTINAADWDFASWGFPVYVIVVSGAIALLILRPRLQRSLMGHSR